MTILFYEILVIIFFAALYVWVFRKKKNIPQLVLDASLIALIFGIPILFTSATRSVFEVTKLFHLRFIQLVMAGTIFLSYIFSFKTSHDQKNENSFSKKKILIIIGIWLAVNVISFLFAPNKTIAWIGAYDRWEGLVTAFNYMIMFYLFFSIIKFKNQITWIIGALLFSGFISSVYGILQSVGWDFMKWSVDPTARVFASINNPVHYSAYIAMLIPPLITSLIYIIRDNKYDFSTLMVEKKSEIRGIGLIIVGAIISIGSMVYSFWIGLGIFFGITLGGAYYLFKNKEKLINLASPVIWALYIISISIFTFFYTANFISFGRGTWVGFSTALMFLYFFLFKLYNQKNIYISMVTMGLGILLANAIVVFKVQDFSSTGAIMVYGLVALFLLSEFLIHRNLKNLGAKLLILVYCANLQFSTVSLKAVVISLACIALLWFLFKKLQNIKINILTMSAFVFILFIPSSITILYEIRFDSQVKKLVKIEEKVGNRKLAADEIELIKQTLHAKLNAAGKITKRQNNILAKTKAYASHLQSGTARTSMWKSAIGLSVSNLRDPNFNAWVKEHPFLGTGPGTIKAFFPRYRRPDYGRLEGGHNFTPDKLHNEYVNTIATRGLLGFFVYYILLLPYCGYLFLKRIKENPDALSNYLTIGLMAGVMVYLGQVMFNFGVVATKAIYYELLGISMAIILNNPFGDYVNRSSE